MDDYIVFVFGIIIGIVLIALFYRFLNHKAPLRKGMQDYDERQIKAQGKAYKCAFYTAMVLIVLTGMINDMGLFVGNYLIEQVFILITCFVVFGIICILNDAYLSLKESPKRKLSVLYSLGIFNLVIGIIGAFTDHLYSGGEINVCVINIYCGLACLILGLVYDYQRRHDDEES